MGYMRRQKTNYVKATFVAATASSLLFLGVAKAAEIPLITDNGTDTGWVAITNDADGVMFTSITIPSPNNMALKVNANIASDLHIRFEQKK